MGRGMCWPSSGEECNTGCPAVRGLVGDTGKVPYQRVLGMMLVLVCQFWHKYMAAVFMPGRNSFFFRTYGLWCELT